MFPRWSVIFCFALLISACGQSGQLYLPKKTTSQPVATVQENPSAPQKASW